ncbi:PDZ domain-containing protein [Aeromicrobium sp. SMF47]|uniref:S1C family serine protease n=1 Tax=Aeromicrobium yanjiei TaxID=2662028 RepID=UPI00129E522D|nr:trypsin-like peptidase domain-containing protein [Aeromicrobium yanjiei]MRJ75811.1 PDZ domain-containing protein [Aeromicrobium yanjiei]
MTDSNDPFAAKPYVPPADRDNNPHTADPEAQSPQPAAPEGTTSDPVSSEPPAPPAPSGQEPTIVSQEPLYSAPQDDPPPAADDHTHRYESMASDPQPAQGSYSPGPTGQQGYPQGQQGQQGYEHTAPLPPFAGDNGGNAGTGNGAGTTGSTPPPKKKNRTGRALAGALALIVLAGGAGFGGAYVYDQTNDDGDSNGSTISSLDSGSSATDTKVASGTVTAVAEKVLPSVVQINVKGQQESGSGTGIIISNDGNILTNNHVVDVAGNGGTITVAFNDGSNAKAEIVGTDPKTDLAVIKAEGKTDLEPATLGNSADLVVGQEVIAIGSPFGLESTVTQGIISALNRPVSSSDGSATGTPTTFPAVQTDAAINPGNSGGPLVDLQGKVIAINSAIRSGGSTSGEAGSIGLGFAIPIDLAKNVAKQLLDGKKVQHAQIGVSVDNFLGEDGITGVGAQVQSVTAGGAAEKAGIKKGDVITAVNGKLIPSSEALVAAVRGFNPGEKITLTYTRDGKKAETDVTLGSDGGKTE